MNDHNTATLAILEEQHEVVEALAELVDIIEDESLELAPHMSRPVPQMRVWEVMTDDTVELLKTFLSAQEALAWMKELEDSDPLLFARVSMAEYVGDLSWYVRQARR